MSRSGPVEPERREFAFSVRELVVDALDECPVVADGAALEPQPAESQRLERAERYPHRGEEMSAAAPHHGGAVIAGLEPAHDEHVVTTAFEWKRNSRRSTSAEHRYSAPP